MGVLFFYDFFPKKYRYFICYVLFYIKRGVIMKKIISILSVLFVLAAGTCFADSDIQTGLRLSAYSHPVDNQVSFYVNAHQFFGETQTFGIAEGCSIEYWGAHLFLGPAFGFNLLDSLRLQVSTGLKWGISAFNGEQGSIFGDSNNLLWGNDVQLKMTADRFCSFIIGVSCSTGVTIVKRPLDETVPTKAWYFDVSPYVGVSFNIRDRNND